VRSQRQIENHLVAQQDRVAGHFNYTNRQLIDEIDRLRREVNQEKDRFNALAEASQKGLTELLERQSRIAELNHQQATALFSRQQKLIESKSAGNGQRAVVNNGQAQPSHSKFDKDRLEAVLIDQMRSAPEVVKEELRPYLSPLKDAGVTEAILDLGSGRAEWLELLREAGLSARGVESNHALAAAGRRRGLEIIDHDANEYLHKLPNNSLSAITGFHVIEHLDFDALLELLVEVQRVLKPGGIVIFETPNPKNLVVGACNFYADPTHHKPLFPETLQMLLEGVGFERVRIEYKHPVEGSPFDNSKPGSQELHTWLFGPRDYAAIAWKA
jgi:SAM-dependent methyltransferase